MGTVERRKREAQQRRQSILDAARKVFWERGFDKSTIPRIAEVAELAAGTIYLYFPSKESLYLELLAEGYELLVTRLAEAAGRSQGAQQRAGAMVDAFLDFAREYPEYFDIIFFVVQRGAGKTLAGTFQDEQLQRLQAWEVQAKQAAMKLLDQAHLADPADRAILVDTIWGMLAGVVFYFRSTKDFDAVARQARTLLLKALFGETPRRGRCRPNSRTRFGSAVCGTPNLLFANILNGIQ